MNLNVIEYKFTKNNNVKYLNRNQIIFYSLPIMRSYEIFWILSFEIIMLYIVVEIINMYKDCHCQKVMICICESMRIHDDKSLLLIFLLSN